MEQDHADDGPAPSKSQVGFLPMNEETSAAWQPNPYPEQLLPTPAPPEIALDQDLQEPAAQGDMEIGVVQCDRSDSLRF